MILFASSCVSASAADDAVIPHRQDRPPNDPYTAEEALKRMTVPPGFHVELVASEPDLVNPIGMTFDDRGRIFVTESLEYPRKDPGPGRDRVKILEDTDGDGRADRFTTFAEGLNIPTGVAVGYGGVWVLNAPDLLYLHEREGHEVSREVVLTGFGRADMHELPSTLTWGPDGWLYGFNGVFNPSRITSGGKVHEFTCALWRFHPRSREFQVFAEGTSNPYGLAWDPEGSAIVEACHWANDHLFHFVETGIYQRQAGAYPPHAIKIGSITDHSHQKTAYCGLAYFDSDAYPESYRGRLYTGNIHGGCINVDRLERDGSTYRARAEEDFLTAHDAWFMPAAQKVGPDGCLYILDWYDRYHCYQDANSDPAGIDRLKGRLYRVRYKDSPRAPRFDLAQESDDALIRRLSSPNIYFRESAQRLLTERNTPEARGLLRRLVLDSSAPRKQRMHALWALVGTGSLEPEFHLELLAHPDPAYRAWAVRAAGNAHRVDDSVRASLIRLSRDTDPDVLLQVAITARKVEGLDPLPLLLDVLCSCGEDKLIPSIVWPNLHPLLAEQGPRFVRLVEWVRLDEAPGLARLLPHALDRILSDPQVSAGTIRSLLSVMVNSQDELSQQAFSIVAERLRGQSVARSAELQRELRPILERVLAGDPNGPRHFSAELLAAQLQIGRFDAESVRKRFLSPDQPEQIRIQAFEALVSFRDPELADTLGKALTTGSPRLLSRVFTAAGRSNDPRVGEVVLAHYSALAVELQPLAIDLLLQRASWTRKLVDAVQQGRLPRSVLNANHLRQILDSNDRETIWAVEKAFGTVRSGRNPAREQVVASMAEYLRKTPGDPHAGQSVFRKLCAQCHTIYGEGGRVGPDLTSNGRASFDQLVSNVFDPSLVIGPAYQTVTVVTHDERAVTGLIKEDSAERVVLVLPGEGEEAIPRNTIKYSRVSNLSMMPEGIENLLDRKELADLFAFLALDKPPDDPQARPIAGAPAGQAPVGSRSSSASP